MNERERHERAMSIFDVVCDLPAQELPSALDKQCGDDQELRAEVESLLAFDDPVSDSISSRGAVQAMAADLIADTPNSAPAPTHIGRYRIVREIGHGGMGIVYEAAQDHPARRVALKVIRQGLTSRQVLRRFEYEANVLGQLDHHGIAKVYEAGTATVGNSTLPFFAMEYVEGAPLDEHAAKLSVRERLELIARVCDAVHHAHQKGIIHRDLKPGNILIKQESTSAGSAVRSATLVDTIGQPKVLDFGIARAVDADAQAVTLQTNQGQLVGTLAYMSPEQVEGGSANLDTRSDVFAIGVMLYRVLAGCHPYDLSGKSVAEAARIIRDSEPPRLTTHDRALRGEVETIVAKAMERDRERRYASAHELAEDIRRHLRDEPILAMPPSAMYQARKFIRRNRVLVGGIAATLGALVIGLIGTVYFLLDAQKQRDAVAKANSDLQAVVDYQAAMLEGVDPTEMGQKIFDDLREEARRKLSAETGEVPKQLASFEQVLSQINATAIASRAMDASIMAPAVDALEAQFASQSSIQTDLRSTVASIYDSIGLPEKALEQAELELEGKQADPGTEHEAAAAEEKICELLLSLGRFDEAERRARTLAEQQERTHGPDHPATLSARRVLAIALTKLSRPDEAEAILLDTQQRLDHLAEGNHSLQIATDLALADLYVVRREIERATELYERILARQQRTLGDDDPATLATLGSVANTYYFARDYERAIDAFERVCNSLERTKGLDHPATLTAHHSLALALTEAGRLDEAAPMIFDTLERQRRVLGSDHPDTVRTLSASGRLMIKQQRWSDAGQYMQEALAIAERTLGPDNTKTLDGYSDVAVVFHKAGRPESGLPYARRTLEGYERVLGAEDRRTQIHRQALAKVLMAMHDFEPAADLLEETIRVMQRDAPRSSIVPGSLGKLTTVRICQGRGDEAVDAATSLLAWFEAQENPNPAVVSRCHLWLAHAHYAAGADQETQTWARSSLELAKNRVPDTSWPIAMARFLDALAGYNLGEVTDPGVVLDALATFEERAPAMLPEDSAAILPWAKKAIAEAGIAPASP
ncbi:MAG: serine/threonine protein kinase [Phycisphaerales bacterium]|nr:serine/threonine protein kinase [Phycisphaerales bacterium]